ncbi:hypothetical protein CkaCkLH20_10816 [Colletotrichum karsti]|uniref:DUF2423 domain-containing protein n=1 Tax=Colletotrichum karsti TaxID=1095194 RepID=A0A9P6LFM6_9PEZI|nr:uncharacterized protein CkaCkLH20_10816 [Colletotrichum karsti]KAF9871618.1 hypothetical protein CkaCkLH20_10816 [Colletotrichum karsti]
MAKSARSSVRKNNNQRLKKNVFGPVESQRTERLSAKLLELAKAPKPEKEADVNMDADEQDDAQINPDEGDEDIKKAEDTRMEVDSSKPRRRSGRIQKQKKTSKIVFPKYKDRRGGSKKKA